MADMDMGWMLLVAGLLLVALEVLAPGVYLLWFGLAALAAGATGVLADLGWQAELGLFCLFSIVAVLAGRWLTGGAIRQDDAGAAMLNQRAAGLVGRTVPLHEALVNGRGSVRIDDTIWRVTGEEDAPAGALVRLVAVQGIGFVVERTDAGNAPGS